MPTKSPITEYTQQVIDGGSPIRAMFDREKEMINQGLNPIGMSLGNPDIKPPKEYFDALREAVALAERSPINLNQYPPNAGFPKTRNRVAEEMEERFEVPFGIEGVIMTAGAANALDVFLATLIDPVLYSPRDKPTKNRPSIRDGSMSVSGAVRPDEVIVPAPFFVEYCHYIKQNQAEPIVVPCDEDSEINPDKVKEAITSKTRAILINSPNNPTGKIYSKKNLDDLAEVLTEASEKHGCRVVCMEDRPYDRLAFGGVDVPSMLSLYPDTVYITSFSKSLGLAGERIGYMAIPKHFFGEHRDAFLNALVINLRTKCINAPVLQQLAIEILGTNVTSNVKKYEERTRRVEKVLNETGFECLSPEGGFYLWARMPRVFESPEHFMKTAHNRQSPLLYTPGHGFGGPSYKNFIRLSTCVSESTIERACKEIPRIVQAA